jgi:hypothetical protein
MTHTNSRDGKYRNSETAFSLAVSDTNEHDIPADTTAVHIKA